MNRRILANNRAPVMGTRVRGRVCPGNPVIPPQ